MNKPKKSKSENFPAGIVVHVRPSGYIWSAAEQFHKAAETSFGSPHFTTMVYPIIVNYALSVELAMKSTVGKTTIFPITNGLVPASATESEAWGHNLDAVFNALPADVQIGVAAEFKLWTGDECAPLLLLCADYFVQGRYAYELKGGSWHLSELRHLSAGMLAATRNFGLISEGLSREIPPSGT